MSIKISMSKVFFTIMIALTSLVAATAGGLSNHADYCDGHLGQWCLLENRIPCHDLSCQILSHPNLKCTGTPEECAVQAAPLCASLPGCVAFAVCHTCSPFKVEWYNATASPTRSTLTTGATTST